MLIEVDLEKGVWAVPLNLSPYFEVVKPSLASGFDYKRLVWEKAEPRGKTGQS